MTPGPCVDLARWRRGRAYSRKESSDVRKLAERGKAHAKTRPFGGRYPVRRWALLGRARNEWRCSTYDWRDSGLLAEPEAATHCFCAAGSCGADARSAVRGGGQDSAG